MGINAATVVQGFHRVGVRIAEAHLDATTHHRWGETVEFEMRLNARFGPLPTRAVLKVQAARGRVASGSLEGARYLLFGKASVLQDGGSAALRIVDSSTSVVRATTTAIVKDDSGAPAVEALEKALRELPRRFAIHLGQPTDGRVG